MDVRFPPKTRIKFVTQLQHVREFQPRPELDRLLDWWRSGEEPVCALTGQDGSGRTAIVERFLRVLTGAFPGTPDIKKDPSLPQPEALFVFSLYSVPHPDGFFGRLGAWLRGEPFVESEVRPSAIEVIWLLRDALQGHLSPTPRLLLVIDGMERCQGEQGDGPEAGELRSDGLRDLLAWSMESRLPGLRVLITGHPHLTRGITHHSVTGRETPVGPLEMESGLGLFRKRKAEGSEEEWRKIIDWCGGHALTVDLAARYVARHGVAQWKEVLRNPDEPPLETRKRSVAALGRLVELHRSWMQEADPALWALLERVSLFRLGVTAEMIEALFVGAGKEAVAGEALATLDPGEVKPRLERLKGFGLLEPYAGGRYSVHPALRRPILEQMDAEESRRCHDRVRRALETVPGGRPALAEATENPMVLDLLEEILHHSLEAGRPREAFNVYWFRMGQFENLGFGLGDLERGERVTRRLLAAGKGAATAKAEGENQGEGEEEGVYLDAARGALQNERALYLDALGRLDEAAEALESVIAWHGEKGEGMNAATGLLNLADLQIQQGRLKAGARTVETALERARGLEDAGLLRTGFALQGYVRFLRGENSGSEADFQEAERWQTRLDEEENPLYSGRGVWKAWFLLGMDRVEEAAALCEANKRICKEFFGEGEPTGPRCDLILAEAAARRGEYQEAERLAAGALQWALIRNARSLACRALATQARVAILDTGTHRLGQRVRTTMEGLWLAERHGYGLLWIDLMLLLARLRVRLGEREDGRREAERALMGDATLGMGGAADLECGYARGEAEARRLLEELTETGLR